MSVEELKHHNLVLEQIVIETNLGPVLRRQLDIGKVLRAPAAVALG